MKKLILAIALAFSGANVFAAAEVGSPAPDFNVKDASGKAHKLSDFKGKIVVLEWYNKDCPYVKKHYESGNMQKVQKQTTEKGVVWLSVISSAKGKQGHLSPKAATENSKMAKANHTAILLDESGEMGKAYGAKTTPHMYLIDKTGKLVYNGAIDSNDSADPKTIAGAENYLLAAVADVTAGKAVATATTKPYGCSVKY